MVEMPSEVRAASFYSTHSIPLFLSCPSRHQISVFPCFRVWTCMFKQGPFSQNTHCKWRAWIEMNFLYKSLAEWKLLGAIWILPCLFSLFEQFPAVFVECIIISIITARVWRHTLTAPFFFLSLSMALLYLWWDIKPFKQNGFIQWQWIHSY